MAQTEKPTKSIKPDPKIEETHTPPDEKKLICGIVMPISAIDGCDKQHWVDVRSIIEDAIEEAGFEGKLVSEADDSGIIQKRIIQNLYDNPIVVCDVSGKNPNVMFELGMRLAFDKPTIIIKDDKTNYSFDTQPIEHLDYPRDLRFNKIIDFKQSLKDKIEGTYKASQDTKNYTTFLKHFGSFKVAKLDEKEAPLQEVMLEEFKQIRSLLRNVTVQKSYTGVRNDAGESICIKNSSKKEVDTILEFISKHDDIILFGIEQKGENHYHINYRTRKFSNNPVLAKEINNLISKETIVRFANR